MNIVKGTVYISALTLEKIRFMFKEIVNHSKHIHEIEAEQERRYKDFAERYERLIMESKNPKE